MLAEVALALRGLDVQAGAGHAEAEPAQQWLDPGCAEDRVVHVVVVSGGQVAVVLRPRLLVGVGVDDELQLGARQGHQPALGEPVHLPLEYLARRGDHRRAVEPGQVRDHQRRAGVPGDPAQRGQIRLHDEVAVAARPGRHLVAVDRVHVRVDRQQVVAPLGVVLHHLGQEELSGQALALEPALHVGEREDHGVDLAGGDELAQLVQGQHPRTSRARVLIGHRQADSSCSIAASSSAVPWTRGPVNQFFAETAQ